MNLVLHAGVSTELVMLFCIADHCLGVYSSIILFSTLKLKIGKLHQHISQTIVFKLDFHAGVSTDLVEKILDPTYMDNEVGDFQAVQKILQTTGQGAAAWVGEAGGAYNSGHHLVTDAFVFSFW